MVEKACPTIQRCIDEGERLFIEGDLFFGHGTDNAADEALWIVFHQLGLPWDSDISVLENTVAESDYKQIQALFKRRVTERLPVPYLTGEAWFAGYPFIVNTDVLIPRSPIAELIEVGFAPWLLRNELSGNDLSAENHPSHILDLCTGSGCIGIATALALPESTVVLSDISTQAIEVARQNIQKYDLGSRVQATVSDVFSALTGQCFDLIVSNPPYVDADDFAAMPAEYRVEPELALVSGRDGLDFTRQLLQQAPDYLTDQGVLICEVGNSWVNLEAAFPSVPFLWLSFERGGHGVFVITKQELIQYRAAFI